MQPRIVQPTKEQVRAYMAAREAARRPPPAPEEIRRLLGWHLERPGPHHPPSEFSRISTNCARCNACLTLGWAAAWARHAPFSFLNPWLICIKPTFFKCENLTA